MVAVLISILSLKKGMWEVYYTDLIAVNTSLLRIYKAVFLFTGNNKWQQAVCLEYDKARVD